MAFNLQNLHSSRDYLLRHPVYNHINTPERLCIFMQHHVFAVWDFMSLLKSLQQSLTCVQVPWSPNNNSKYARFINEIVLGEETDEDGHGGYCSHFELYLEAMEEIGADTNGIAKFLHALESGKDPLKVIEDLDIPITIRAFVKNTLQLALHGKIHEITAAFFFGREDLIPDMFTALLNEMRPNGFPVNRFEYYLQRHIELDGDHHGPLAEKLLVYVCKDDSVKEIEAERVAQRALELRIQLWDGVISEINRKGV